MLDHACGCPDSKPSESISLLTSGPGNAAEGRIARHPRTSAGNLAAGYDPESGWCGECRSADVCRLQVRVDDLLDEIDRLVRRMTQVGVVTEEVAEEILTSPESVIARFS